MLTFSSPHGTRLPFAHLCKVQAKAQEAVVAALIKEATEADAAIERRRQAAARVRIEAELLEQARRGDENIRELIAIHEAGPRGSTARPLLPSPRPSFCVWPHGPPPGRDPHPYRPPPPPRGTAAPVQLHG